MAVNKSGSTVNWNSDYSTASTPVTTPAYSVPVLTATRISESQINLSWTDANSDETGYKVERCSIATCTDSDFAVIATKGANVFSHPDTTINPVASYTYRVRAYKTVSSGCPWDSLSNTQTVPSSILPPTGLSAAQVAGNTTQLNLSWTDNTASETEFDLLRCDGSGSNCIATPLTRGASSSNPTTYSDTTVCAGATYTYQVMAVNKSGSTINWSSAYSTASTPVTTASPVAPTSFGATRTNEAKITLSWTDTNADRGGFELQRCPGDSTACI